MTEPRNLSPEELELRQALVSAWHEVFKQHVPRRDVELKGVDVQEALQSFFMMIGSVAGIMIAGATDDPSDRTRLSQAVSMNIPYGIESRDRFKRYTKTN